MHYHAPRDPPKSHPQRRTTLSFISSMLCVPLILLTLFTLITMQVIEYDEEAKVAQIVGKGKATVHHTVPLSLYVYNITECGGNLEMCYKSTDTSNGQKESQLHCEIGYCKFFISLKNVSSPIAPPLAIGDHVEFKFNHSAPFSCPMESIDGKFTYDIKWKPRRCKIVFAGVTAPKEEPTTTEQDKLEKAYIALWISIGVIILVIILVGIVIMLIFFVICPALERRNQSSRRRRAQTAQIDETVDTATTAPLIIPPSSSVQPPTDTAKTKKKATPIKKGSEEPSKPGSTDITKTKSAEPQKQTSAEPKKQGSKDDVKLKSTEPLKKAKAIKKDDDSGPTPKFEDPPPKEDPDALLLRLLPFMETCLGSLQRLNRIKPEINNAVSAVWDTEVQHDLSKFEKQILRYPASIGIDALEQLTAELDHGLLANGAAYGTNKIVPQCWEYANFRGIAASACYRLFVMTYSSEFVDIKPSLDDPLVAKISIPGLYMLLMIDTFDRSFREKLIVELRSRAKTVLKELPTESLSNSSFPMSYLSKLYGDGPGQFVEGTTSKAEKRK